MDDYDTRLEYLEALEQEQDAWGSSVITHSEFTELQALRSRQASSSTDVSTTSTTDGPDAKRQRMMDDIRWREIAEEIDEKDLDWQGWTKAYNRDMRALLNLRKQVGGRQINVPMPQVTLQDYVDDPKVIECYLYIERWKLRKKLGMAPPSNKFELYKYNHN